MNHKRSNIIHFLGHYLTLIIHRTYIVNFYGVLQLIHCQIDVDANYWEDASQILPVILFFPGIVDNFDNQ